MLAPGLFSVVELWRPILTKNTKNIKGNKTYVEAAWLLRPPGNCPACPVLNPALGEDVLTGCNTHTAKHKTYIAVYKLHPSNIIT